MEGVLIPAPEPPAVPDLPVPGLRRPLTASCKRTGWFITETLYECGRYNNHTVGLYILRTTTKYGCGGFQECSLQWKFSGNVTRASFLGSKAQYPCSQGCTSDAAARLVHDLQVHRGGRVQRQACLRQQHKVRVHRVPQRLAQQRIHGDRQVVPARLHPAGQLIACPNASRLRCLVQQETDVHILRRNLCESANTCQPSACFSTPLPTYSTFSRLSW